PERFRDHELTGNLKGNRECHILPDLLPFTEFSTTF
ncbi:MAG: type II toxin-antitoxin system YafQ family toxin, partial [Treponema berlinense]|nr:type II toxin-antitoxin system YafQ family toxin [Treponema berlinense]